MKILRVTECLKPVRICGRGLFSLLEHYSHFSLLECRGKERLTMAENHQVLVLDHLDQASNPTSILEQVIEVQADIRLLIVVDQSRSFSALEKINLLPLCHLVLGDKKQKKWDRVPASTHITNSVDQAVAYLQTHLWSLRTSP